MKGPKVTEIDVKRGLMPGRRMVVKEIRDRQFNSVVRWTINWRSKQRGKWGDG